MVRNGNAGQIWGHRVGAEWAVGACGGWFTKTGDPAGPSTASDFPASPGSYLSQRGLHRSEFPWKPFLWPSLHVISQVGCNQTPTGQRMSSQTAILGFHPNCLHFLFKLVISPQGIPCPSRDLLGSGELWATVPSSLPRPQRVPPTWPGDYGQH